MSLLPTVTITLNGLDIAIAITAIEMHRKDIDITPEGEVKDMITMMEAGLVPTLGIAPPFTTKSAYMVYLQALAASIKAQATKGEA